MNFSFIIKTIFISLFMFMLIYAINFSSTQQDMTVSNNFGVKNAVKESLNIGYLRVHDEIKFNESELINATINNYIKNNNIKLDNVQFDIGINNNIVTVKIKTKKNLFLQDSGSTAIFSYIVERKQ